MKVLGMQGSCLTSNIKCSATSSSFEPGHSYGKDPCKRGPISHDYFDGHDYALADSGAGGMLPPLLQLICLSFPSPSLPYAGNSGRCAKHDISHYHLKRYQRREEL